MIDVEKIKSTVYTLLRKDFKIEVDDGTSFTFRFRMFHFYHLLGFHYLRDLPDISNPKHIDEVVRRFLRGSIAVSDLQKSDFFHKIEKRMECFPRTEEMLISGRCEIIVDFDPSLVPATSVHSKYFLYKTDDHITYHLLGIARSGNNTYYPETFFVEPSKYYISGQQLRGCVIEYIEHPLKNGNNMLD